MRRIPLSASGLDVGCCLSHRFTDQVLTTVLSLSRLIDVTSPNASSNTMVTVLPSTMFTKAASFLGQLSNSPVDLLDQEGNVALFLDRRLC